MSEVGRYDFTIRQGATFTRTFTVKDGDGVAIDLTGYGAHLRIRDRAGEVLEVYTEASGLTLGDEDGTIVFTLTDEETTALDLPGLVRYNLNLETPSGDVDPVLEGYIGWAVDTADEGAS